MTTQVQELINKIKTDGIQEAEQGAADILSRAKKEAESIVTQARQQSDQLKHHTEVECKKVRESTHMALQQASRDMLLNLRREIEASLMRLVHHDIQKALTPETLAAILQETIQGYLKQSEGGDITITLSDKDLKKLKEGYITKLKDKVKKPIVFQSSDEVSAGFTISYDSGKSCFDFTDASLVEYLSHYLNTEISSLLKETTSS